MPAAFLSFRSFRAGSTDRAGSLAGAALDAEFRIDDADTVDLGDSSDRASGFTCSAVHTEILIDSIRHCNNLLVIDWLKL